MDIVPYEHELAKLGKYAWGHRQDMWKAAKKVGRAWRAHRRKRGKRSVGGGGRQFKRAVEREIHKAKEAHIHTNHPQVGKTGNTFNVWAADDPKQVAIADIPRRTTLKEEEDGNAPDVGAQMSEAFRQGDEVYLSGIRLHTCFTNKLSGIGHPDTNTREIYIRMVLVEDTWDKDTGTDLDGFFSGIGHQFSGNTMDKHHAKQGNDFDEITPICTKIYHPINSKRWKVYWQKRIKLTPRANGTTASQLAKFWIPMKEKITYITKGTGGAVPDKDLKLVYWYETGEDDSYNGAYGWATGDVKVCTYFKNRV